MSAGRDRPATDAALARLRDNAFHVLELGTACSRLDVERQGQKLLAMLELGLAAAKRYETPVGEGERDADKVRVAMAKLRDPDKRLEEEIWARVGAKRGAAGGPGAAGGDGAGAAGGDGAEKPEDAAFDPDADLGLDEVKVDALPRAPRADRAWAEALPALGWSRR